VVDPEFPNAPGKLVGIVLEPNGFDVLPVVDELPNVKGLPVILEGFPFDNTSGALIPAPKAGAAILPVVEFLPLPEEVSLPYPISIVLLGESEAIEPRFARDSDVASVVPAAAALLAPNVKPVVGVGVNDAVVLSSVLVLE